MAQQALLLDRCGFGITLRDDQAAKGRAVFARHFLPHVLPHVVTKTNFATLFLVRHEDAPAVVRHGGVAVTGPARRIHTHSGAQVNVFGLEVRRSHLVPPVQKSGLPMLQRPLELAVFTEAHVVGDQGLKVYGAHCFCS